VEFLIGVVKIGTAKAAGGIIAAIDICLGGSAPHTDLATLLGLVGCSEISADDWLVLEGLAMSTGRLGAFCLGICTDNHGTAVATREAGEVTGILDACELGCGIPVFEGRAGQGETGAPARDALGAG
jgi:hypothetical protein